MKLLKIRRNEPASDVSLLCELFRWNELEARIFLGSFGLRGLFSTTPAELVSLGLNVAPVSAFQELMERLRAPAPLVGPFSNSRQVFDAYRDFFRGRTHEIFVLLLLNGKNRVLRDEVISQGSLTASLVHPREAFTPAVRHSAAAVIFLHNHPSGDPEPSTEDRQITQRLVECGHLLGVRVLDHIIVGDGCYFSFLDKGELGKANGEGRVSNA
ncbi:MAG TPA: JAB domain-containing protein [Acidobacteriota bacterium]|jgi:DNA repair protein RadC|nr:JAB domain-containing protein [Acidobacteriota bacterium]